MNRRHIMTALAGSLLLALVASQVVLFKRLRRMQDEITSLRADRPGTSASRQETLPSGGTGAADSGDSLASLPAPRDGATPMKAGGEYHVPDPSASVNAGDVENIVRRMMKKREAENPIASLLNMSMEDPLDLMKRELGLNASQVLRIKEHRESRQAAMDDLYKSALMNSDRQAWSEQWQAVQNNYESMVKSELDYNQQQKYDELKNSGQLHDWGGVSGKGAAYRVVVGGVKKVDGGK